jgi:Integrase zinc binding domain
MAVAKEHCCFLLSLAHNNVGHYGFHATNALLSERYWWLHMAQDITWFVLTCHICQVQKTRKILILLIVTMLALLFIWTLCICRRPLVTGSYFKAVALLFTGRNGFNYGRNPLKPSVYGFYMISFTGGVWY